METLSAISHNTAYILVPKIDCCYINMLNPKLKTRSPSIYEM